MTLTPVDLRVERATDPLGVDELRPLLSWRLAGPGRGRAQTAYQIVVDRDGGERVWDSGPVVSAESVDLPYGGPPPRPRTRYHWRVRVTDEAGRQSGWSDPASWETGQLDAARWRARWITSPAEAAAPPQVDLDTRAPFRNIERIWAVGNPDRALFRTEFTVPPGRRVLDARLTVAGATVTSTTLNGTPVGDDPRAAVRGGRNVLAIGATAGALVARLEVAVEDLPPVVVVTSDRWRATADLDDDNHASWPKAVALGPHGAPPWGREPVTYRPSPYLRRTFQLTAPVRRARLYATAAGLYTMAINGTRAGDHCLAPGWTDYHVRIAYQTYDVTDLLEQGDNALSAVLADGWFAGRVGFMRGAHYGQVRALRAELHIEHSDGTHTYVGTDETWQVGEGAIRYADLQNGEVVDARLEPSGWVPAVVVPGPAGAPEAQIAEPIRVHHELPARAVTARRPGTFIVDFGQNITGWVRIRLQGQAGHRIMLRHAEVLDHNGELYLEALRTARATNEYVLRGDPDGEVYEPTFTVHGFRYCEVSGHPGELTTEDITALAAYADMPATGDFACSSGELNQLQSNIVWGQRGNFLTVPTDCPQRDERLGWTGDAQVFSATAAFNYDVRSFLRKWLRDVCDAQRPDGAIAHVAPDIMTAADAENPVRWSGSGGWGDAIAIVPDRLLTAYADRRAVAETLDATEGWLRYLERHGGGDQPDGGYADWLAVTPTPKKLVNTAYFAYTARVAARLAATVDDPRAERWHTLADRLRAEFQVAYVGGGGRVSSGTQTAYVLALHAGLLESGDRAAAVARLVHEVESRHDHLTTGFLGTPWLLDALTDGGRVDVAYRLLTQDSYPSWLYPVVHGGATTIWERWDSWSDSRGFQNPHMTSFNHYAYGAVGDWIYRTVAGLAPAEPGYRRLLVRPRPGGGLTWARASLSTVHGPAAVAWRLDGDGFTLDVTVPPNTSAEVWLPAADPAKVTEGDQPAEAAEGVRKLDVVGEAVFTVGSGEYHFHASEL